MMRILKERTVDSLDDRQRATWRRMGKSGVYCTRRQCREAIPAPAASQRGASNSRVEVPKVKSSCHEIRRIFWVLCQCLPRLRLPLLLACALCVCVCVSRPEPLGLWPLPFLCTIARWPYLAYCPLHNNNNKQQQHKTSFNFSFSFSPWPWSLVLVFVFVSVSPSAAKVRLWHLHLSLPSPPPPRSPLWPLAFPSRPCVPFSFSVLLFAVAWGAWELELEPTPTPVRLHPLVDVDCPCSAPLPSSLHLLPPASCSLPCWCCVLLMLISLQGTCPRPPPLPASVCGVPPVCPCARFSVLSQTFNVPAPPQIPPGVGLACGFACFAAFALRRSTVAVL